MKLVLRCGVAVAGLGVLVVPFVGSATAAPRVTETTGAVATSTTLTASPSQLAHGHPTTLTALVTPSPGSSTISDGTMTFSDAKGDDLSACTGQVNETDDGSASAFCTTSALSVGTFTVTATYSGTATFGPSHGQATVTVTGAAAKPTITDRLTAAHAKTTYGWYRSPVTITFSCHGGSAPLTAPCPKPVVLSKNKAKQTVTRTITDHEGGSATITIKGINIDKVAPTIAIHGLSHGRLAAGKKLTMTARDKLSGVSHRGLSSRRTGTVVHYTATARDRAGNVRTVKGKYRR